jgi:hypothetical protein
MWQDACDGESGNTHAMAHFGSREGILTAVAIAGFQELGLALETIRKQVRRVNSVKLVAAGYLGLAAAPPARMREFLAYA